MTINVQSQCGHQDSSTATPSGSPPPPPPQDPMPSSRKIESVPHSLVTLEQSSSIAPKRPTELSISMSESNLQHLDHNGHSQEHLPSTNTMTSTAAAGEKGNGRDRDEKEVSVPSLVVETTHSAPPKKRRKSEGLLDAPELSSAIRLKLGKQGCLL